MEFLIFLLGGAFGMILCDLSLLAQVVQEEGLSKESLLEMMYILAAISFICSLLRAYIMLG